MDDFTPQDREPGEPAIDSEAIGTDQADETSAAAQRQRRTFFITFGSIVFLGLALTILYLGGRVRETRAAATPASNPQPVARQVTPKAPAVTSAATVAVAKAPEPAAAPAAKNEPKEAEVSKIQLVAEAKPAPVAPIPQPVPESKPAPISKPAVAVDPPAPAKVYGKAPEVAKLAPTAKPAPVVAPPQAETTHPESKGILTRSQKPYDGPLLKPRPGERYVQVGAYSPNYTGSFLAILEKKGIHGVVAPGPSQDVNRVLVGPFSDSEVIKDTYSQLGKAGLAGAFGRKY